MDEQLIWLALACFFNWLALGLLIFRYSRFERLVFRFMTDPAAFETVMRDMAIRREIERREGRRSAWPPDVEPGEQRPGKPH
jgi:hypothetical protein